MKTQVNFSLNKIERNLSIHDKIRTELKNKFRHFYSTWKSVYVIKMDNLEVILHLIKVFLFAK